MTLDDAIKTARMLAKEKGERIGELLASERAVDGGWVLEFVLKSGPRDWTCWVHVTPTGNDMKLVVARGGPQNDTNPYRSPDCYPASAEKKPVPSLGIRIVSMIFFLPSSRDRHLVRRRVVGLFHGATPAGRLPCRNNGRLVHKHCHRHPNRNRNPDSQVLYIGVSGRSPRRSSQNREMICNASKPPLRLATDRQEIGLADQERKRGVYIEAYDG